MTTHEDVHHACRISVVSYSPLCAGLYSSILKNPQSRSRPAHYRETRPDSSLLFSPPDIPSIHFARFSPSNNSASRRVEISASPIVRPTDRQKSSFTPAHQSWPDEMLPTHVIALIVILLLGVSGLVVWAAFILRFMMATAIVNEEG
ncbi:hypothetical protein L873DRAFT_1476901 [Choiromyces venosus 120613-1]|uniref:Uncharacterized protein n=1 Tax=Choiromyces venosus 120613-1 TaxID=1336337 RepID=A0A3N4J7B0_9PEZI|nr:hypothetical protein L873DRAFT_1476901 [Choiromyces venosus 120613-1]